MPLKVLNFQKKIPSGAHTRSLPTHEPMTPSTPPLQNLLKLRACFTINNKYQLKVKC